MRLASTEPIEDTATKIRPLHTEHKYKCYIRTQNLADLDEPSNATRETKIRENLADSTETSFDVHIFDVFPNQDSQDRIEATIIGSSKSEIIWYRKNHAIIDLFANSRIIFLCQTIRQDTDLYRLQVTN
ncbi:unnamed protein product [Rotaria sordida]|uniref:Uncharacterized protein n=1 Tax=Rotaria sordida TaxID=392033 RepID=A0A818V242_9BILA|nr:unnamed protein product [Rotaria sordida]